MGRWNEKRKQRRIRIFSLFFSSTLITKKAKKSENQTWRRFIVMSSKRGERNDPSKTFIDLAFFFFFKEFVDIQIDQDTVGFYEKQTYFETSVLSR